MVNHIMEKALNMTGVKNKKSLRILNLPILMANSDNFKNGQS